MALAPVRPSNIVTSAASTASGDVKQTVKVQNSAIGKNQLVITLTNASTTNDRDDIPIFPGIWATSSKLSLPADISMSVRSFASRDEFLAMAEHVGFAIEGVEVSTTNTDNFTDDTAIVQYQKSITGKESDKVETFFSDFKVNNGGGTVDPSFKIRPEDFTCVVTGLLRMELSHLKKQSSVTFKFNISGMQKAIEISAMDAVQF